jgi:hypothetical protein
VKRLLITVLPILLAACGTTDWSKEPLPVTVSAANYSQSSYEEIYTRVHGATNTSPAPPAISVPDKPLFYGFVPGDIYDSDVALPTVYRELAISLAHRGYFNVVYQAEAGYMPKRVDYLIRVHCGVRRWRNPIVRTDKVTWGNDSLIDKHRDGRSAYMHGEEAALDSRAGQDPMEAVNVAAVLQSIGTSTIMAQTTYSTASLGDSDTRDYCLVVVEAFKFSDLMALKDNAPCEWATFIAVPLHSGQKFSNMLQTMAKTATPYFGTTTNGIQEYDLPAGKVIMGEPVEVQGPQISH